MRSFVANIEDVFTLKESLEGKNITVKMFDEGNKNLMIPAYQRPYNWSKDRIKSLIDDAMKQSKFFGIIILNENDDCFEIIDGQQRLTTFYITFAILYNFLKLFSVPQRYNKEPYDPCKQINQILFKNGLSVLKNDAYGDDEESFVIEANGYLQINTNLKDGHDLYYQEQAFVEVYKYISEELFNHLRKKQEYVLETDEHHITPRFDLLVATDLKEVMAQKLLKNLLKCKLLVLVMEKDDNDLCAENIFMDINEKAEKLDPAAIFKGHCFKNFESVMYETLKGYWSSIIKNACEFEKRFKIKELSKYIYNYCLIAKDNKISEQMTNENGHILENLPGDQTQDFLQDMISFGEDVILFDTQIHTDQYKFEDLVCDSDAHKNDEHLQTMKIMAKEILKGQGTANYQKLPFMYLIHSIMSNKHIRDVLTFNDLLEIFSNYYAYAMMFLNSIDLKQGKENVDITIRDELIKEEPFQIKNLASKVRKLKKDIADSFEVSGDIKQYNRQAFIFSIIDFYDWDKNRLSKIYESETNEVTNQEHFIVPSAHRAGIKYLIDINADVKNQTDKKIAELDKIEFPIKFTDEREQVAKERKNHLINYLILPKSLNGEIKSYDLIHKIDVIKTKLTVGGKLPKHIEIYISSIENMQEYQKLKELKTELRNKAIAELCTADSKKEFREKKVQFIENNKEIVNKTYEDFMIAYFNEKNERKLIESLDHSFRNN